MCGRRIGYWPMACFTQQDKINWFLMIGQKLSMNPKSKAKFCFTLLIKKQKRGWSNFKKWPIVKSPAEVESKQFFNRCDESFKKTSGQKIWNFFVRKFHSSIKSCSGTKKQMKLRCGVTTSNSFLTLQLSNQAERSSAITEDRKLCCLGKGCRCCRHGFGGQHQKWPL